MDRPQRFVLAVVGVRYTAEPKSDLKKPKAKERGFRLTQKSAPAKCNHAEMLAERLAGASWKQIADKHGVRGGGTTAATLCLNSRAARSLTPKQVELLTDISSPNFTG